jgi:hypothetical protein
MLSDLERRALKNVVGHAVKLAGGQENAVNVTSRISRAAAFSDYANAALEDRHCPIDVAIELDQFNVEPLILKTMARMTGQALIPLPRITASDTPLGRITGEAMKEVSDVFGTLGRQLEDGTLSAIEGPFLEREIDEAVEKLLALKLQARAVVERGSR